MNKFTIFSFCTVLSFSFVSCYAPVEKSGSQSLTNEVQKTESQKASENYIALAFKYIEANQIATARTKLDQAIGFDNKNPRIYLGYALIYDREQETDLAIANYKKASDLGGGSEVSLYRALSYYNRGDFVQAQQYFVQCTADTSYEKRALCYELNGFNFMRLDQPDQAIDSFIKATQLNPAMPVSLLSLSNLYLQKDDHVQGDKAFKKYDEMTEFVKNVKHTSQSLWIGIQLAHGVGEDTEMKRLALQLKVNFPESEEQTLFNQWSQNLGSN